MFGLVLAVRLRDGYTPPPTLSVLLCTFQSGDTVLIGAVRGGHVEIVRALLHKYADIDIQGQVGGAVHLVIVHCGHAGPCLPLHYTSSVCLVSHFEGQIKT